MHTQFCLKCELNAFRSKPAANKTVEVSTIPDLM